MTESLDFLAQSPAFYVATVDETGHPRVRPFSFVMEWNGKLTFTTNTTKSVYRQLQQNPGIEICSFSPTTGEWMRICGRAVFTDDMDARRKVFEVMPALKQMYGSADNPIVTCFWIEAGEASVYTLASMDKPLSVIRF